MGVMPKYLLILLTLTACTLNPTAEGSESNSIVVTPTIPSISSDFSTYTIGQPIRITWSGLTSNPTDWVDYAPNLSLPASVTRWSYTGAAANGSRLFEGALAPGTYVARAFSSDSYTKIAESAPFVVAGDSDCSGACYMNLPDSRDITFTPADLIPSAFLNDIQDQIIGHRRTAFKRPFFPLSMFKNSGHAFDQAANPSGSTHSPVYISAAGPAQTDYFSMPTELADVVSGMSIEIYGDGAVGGTFGVYVQPGAGGTPVRLGFLDTAMQLGGPIPSGWTNYTIPRNGDTISGTFVPHSIVDGDVMFVKVTANGSGVMTFGWMVPTISR